MNSSGQPNKHTRESGAWPFVSRRISLGADGTQEVLHARHLRKGLDQRFTGFEHRLGRILWRPRDLNWWIGIIFAVGASLFSLASILFLSPDLAASWFISANNINAMYFAGSIPFTTAAYLQLYQAANSAPWCSPVKNGRVWLGWRPADIGWTSCALQFAGTLLFNINTFNGMQANMDWLEADLRVWVPDAAGSVLFLASGYLAWTETCHAHFAWMPRSLPWWITAANLFGCIAFMVSAIYAFTPPDPGGFGDPALAVAFTLAGALGFLLGSLLMLGEVSAPTSQS